MVQALLWQRQHSIHSTLSVSERHRRPGCLPCRLDQLRAGADRRDGGRDERCRRRAYAPVLTHCTQPQFVYTHEVKIVTRANHTLCNEWSLSLCGLFTCAVACRGLHDL